MNDPGYVTFARTRLSDDQYRRQSLGRQPDLLSHPPEEKRDSVQLFEAIPFSELMAAINELFGNRRKSGGLRLAHRLDFAHDQEQPVGILQREEIDVPAFSQASRP